ncbi:MAG: phage integrase N-terminal SAM-like domain-containing protein, partial [Verrucomicrobiota bacterium]
MQHDAANVILAYEQLLAQRKIPSGAKSYYLHWAKTWSSTVNSERQSFTEEFFKNLGRCSNLAPWQFQQAIRAVAWLARDILQIPWAQSFDWRGLVDQAEPLEPDHRTLGRETIRVPSEKPKPSIAPGFEPLPETEAEVARICEELRRAIRLGGLSYATEQTYVHWNTRFTRFCLIKLKQTPQNAGPQAITGYLNYLALERNISPSTQKQALNAMVFLTRKVFGVEDFTLEKGVTARGQRRPPIVLTRGEVQSVIGHLESPWKLAAQLMYGSGLRLMETLRLRVKDIDFGQGTIIINDGKGGKHRVVPLPRALETRLKEHLARESEKHANDLAGGCGEVHLPEALLRKYPNASREWPWQFLFPAATFCPHPKTGKVAKFHLHDASMQRQFKEATRKANLSK